MLLSAPVAITVEAIETLVAMLGAESERTRVAAAEALLSKGSLSDTHFAILIKVSIYVTDQSAGLMSYRERLGHLRTRLAMVRTSHLLLGAGCACGLPAGHIDVSSVDSTIAAHLAEKYRNARRQRLSALFASSLGDDRLSTIISTLFDGATALDDADYATLCEDLETAIESLEELTGGKSRRTSRFQSL